MTSRQAQVTAAAIYGAYSQWAREAGETPLTAHAFGRRLRERGFVDARTGRARLWRGGGRAQPGDPGEA